MDFTLLYITIAVGLSGLVIQRSKVWTICIYFFAWTLMWTKYTPDYSAYQDIYYSNFEFRDVGYQVLCAGGRMLGLTFFEFFMSIGFVAMALYCVFTLRYVHKNSLVAGLWMLCVSMFDIVQFRNFLAFAVLLCFIPLLFKPTRNRLILYVVGVALASTIHLTMSFYLLFIFMNTQWFSAKYFRIILIPLLVVCVGVYLGLDMYSEKAERLMSLYDRKTSDLTKWAVGFLLVGNAVFVYLWSRRKTELMLTPREIEFSVSPGHIVTLMNVALIVLLPISFQSLTVMRLYKYMAIVNFGYIANHMASYTNWRLAPQTALLSLYALSYLALMIFIHAGLFLKTIAKPIFMTNIFWPTVAGYF
ncbi:MAG: hypothetical protein HDS67_04535 [Bacteroidales bacterium]|nr:hypothetical protein [Bacteroidales bacterium]